MCGAVLVALTSTWIGMGCCRGKTNTTNSVHVDELVPCILDSERAQRSRQHERGTSAERRYKRSHRRSPTSGRRRHGGHRHGGHTHRHHHPAVAASAAAADHSRRSSYSSQVSACVLPRCRLSFPPLLAALHPSNHPPPPLLAGTVPTATASTAGNNHLSPSCQVVMPSLDARFRFEHFVDREFLTTPLVALGRRRCENGCSASAAQHLTNMRL
uniref:Secreted protein n=1 Tax=Timema douglasi TaxID=61478 RepID=A0A7R8VD98_TIMDO|nr:unnamed protein product [Timema douglasi]